MEEEIKSICPKCSDALYESDVIDWDDGRPIYECGCGCMSINNGEDISEEYEY